MTQHSHSQAKEKRHGRTVVAGLIALSVGLLSTAGVYAALTAVATGSESVTSGTLLLTVGPDTGSVGFPASVTNMAPGDTMSTYVNLKNTGTLAGSGITLSTSALNSNPLTNGSIAGEGLNATITECSVAWTAAGACTGTSTVVLASTPVSTMLSTPTSLASSALAAGGAINHLQFTLGLSGTETSTNGVLPAATIQGLSNTVTFTFTESQRTPVSTNQ
jgi:hypothetical protein